MGKNLTRKDYLLVGLVSVVLFGYALIERRPLTMHEAVLPQNAREMYADRDWLIPKYGGQPWLERPPLPQWITVGLAGLIGHCDREWIVRLGPVLMGVSVVLLVAWMTSVWYGRGLALCSALVLATMWEFYTYASDAEADIYLCLIVTAALALFVRLEFLRRPAGEESVRFLGGRPWLVLAFFVLFGATNLAKGLIFGTLMVAVPVAGYLLWNADLQAIRRYVWLWGWLAFVGVALAWPTAIYQKYPDVLELWASDYVGRLNQGFIQKPVWYYAVTLPWVLLPWTFAAGFGLYLTARTAFTQPRSPERFLWSWAILTPLIFSIPQGKHHHYLLQCLAPWAVLAARGAVHAWQAIQRGPAWGRNPTLALLTVALPIDLAVAAFAAKIPGPSWIVPLLLVACPLFVFGFAWAVAQRDGRHALAAFFTLLTALYCAVYSYKTHALDRYYDDTLFVQQTRDLVPRDDSLFINFDRHALEAFRILFYLDDNAKLLHNLTYLLDERIADDVVYVVGRFGDAAELAGYGSPEVVLQSRHTRGETSPLDRWTLFRVRLHPDRPRHCAASVYIRPMQASGRAPGPFLQ